MSLARALTSRRKEATPASNPSYMGRAASQRAPNAKPIKRAEISLPVALVSTTNMLSYEAPNIVDAHHVQNLGGRYFSAATATSPSIGSSADSDNESDHSGSIRSFHTDATSLDMPSPDLSDNHYHNFFKSSAADSPARAATTTTRSSRSSTMQSEKSRPSLENSSPKIPQRAPSHSINAHVLAHRRSVQRMTASSTNSLGRHSSDQWRPAPAAAPPATAAAHPFGKELEQLNEAAEEFGAVVRNAEAEADLRAMDAVGLVRFCAADYMDEISSMYSTRFDEDRSVGFSAVGWI